MPGPPAIIWHASAAPITTPPVGQWVATLTIPQAIPSGAFVLVLPVIDYGSTVSPGNVFSVNDSASQVYTEFTAFTVADINPNPNTSAPTPGSHIVWYKVNHPGLGVGGTITCSGYVTSGFHVYVLRGVDATTPIPSVAKQRWGAGSTGVQPSDSSGATPSVTRTNVMLIGGINENETTAINAANTIAFSSNEIASPWTLAETMQYIIYDQYSPPNFVYYGTRLVTGYRFVSNASGAQSFSVSASATAEPNPSAMGAVYNEVFCIVVNGETNVAPNAPTLAGKSNFSSTSSTVFGWVFSDPNAVDAQTAFQLQVLTNPGGAVAFDSGKVTSAAASYTMPANSLAANANYQWKVRTWDLSDAAGAYSSLGSFSTVPGPTIVLTSPTPDNVTLTTTTPTVTWTFTGVNGSTQSTYEVVVSLAGITMFDSGLITSTGTSILVTTPLLSTNVVYTVTLTVTDSNNSGSVVTRPFLVAALSPGAITMTAGTSPDGGAVRLTLHTES